MYLCSPTCWAHACCHISWPKYLSFSFNIGRSNNFSGLISSTIGWLDLLAVQGTLKSLLQHHSSKASILWRSALFMVQPSHLYMTTGKTVALTIRTFLGKCLCFVICHLALSYLSFQGTSIFNFMAAVIVHSDFGAQENKVSHCFHLLITCMFLFGC